MAEIALRLDSCSIYFPPTSSTPIISLNNELTLIREHHKGPFTIGLPVLNYLGPPICHLHVCGRCLTTFYDKIRTNKRCPLKGQLRGSLQTSQPMTASSDVCLHELTSASDDHTGVFFYFCLIVCTLPKYFAVFCCH